MKLLAGLIAASLACGFSFGVDYGQNSVEPVVEYVEIPPPEPEIIYETEIIYKTIEVKIPVPTLVEVIKEVEVLVELSEFGSEDELTEWLDQDGTDEVFKLLRKIDPEANCDEAVRILIKHARADGKEISFFYAKAGTWIGNKEYGTFKKLEKNHALGLVFIGKKIFLVDAIDDTIYYDAYVK